MNQFMTESHREKLSAAAAKLGVALSGDMQDKLIGYIELLSRWNRTYNLTAIREPDHMLVQHLFDCLAVVAPVSRLNLPQGARLLDVGSGGGLPGVVLALLFPQYGVTCVDAVGKKIAFIRQAAGELQLANLQGAHERVEHLKLAPFELIASRAFASLAEFVMLTQRLLKPEGVWMAMKGRTPSEEIAELDSAVDVFHVEQLSVPFLEAERCLVWMRASQISQ